MYLSVLSWLILRLSEKIWTSPLCGKCPNFQTEKSSKLIFLYIFGIYLQYSAMIFRYILIYRSSAHSLYIYIPIVGKGRVSCCITFIEYLYIQYIYTYIYICTTWNSTFTHKKLRRCRPHGVVFHVGLVSSQGGSAGVSQRRRPARKAVAGDVIYPAAGWLVGSWRGHP